MRPLVFADTISVRTGADLRARIEAAAAIEGASASDWVRKALADLTAPRPAPSPVNRHAYTPAALIPSVWPEVAPFLAAVCARPGCDHTADSLRTLCERGDAGLMLLMGDDGRPGAAGVLEVRQHESGRRVAWVLAMGGRPVIPWAEWIARIETEARAAGCGTVEFVGRSGWRRILPDYTTEPCEAGTHFLKRLGH